MNKFIKETGQEYEAKEVRGKQIFLFWETLMKSLLLAFLVFWNVRKFYTLKTFQPNLKVLYRIYKLYTGELAKSFLSDKPQHSF
jgi:hypothetical protein